MNNIYKSAILLLTATCCIMLFGCKKLLDKEPVDILTEETLFTDPVVYTSHLAYIYSQLPFSNFLANGGKDLSYKTDEMVNKPQDQNNSLVPDTQWWEDGYKLIRSLNNVLDKLPGSSLFRTPEEIDAAVGEIKFIRAFVYYNLAWRYGGVPIVTSVAPLPKSEDISELYSKRNTELEVFKFVETEMTDAISMMSNATSFNEFRFNKWSALAYKSSAMLYAASIAEYGSVQLDGAVGIPHEEAQHFWEAARDAAKAVIDGGVYGLYDQNSNKVENYHDLFFDKSAANKERVFVTSYVWPLKPNSFDRNSAPYSHRSGEGYGGSYCPTLEMVESYEYLNDRNGALKMSDGGGTPIEYADPEELFKDKDPRFFASVLFPGSPWMGTTLKIYARIIKNGQEQDGFGADGIAQTESTSTGFYLSKWLDPAPPRPIATNSSDVDRINMRYAEVLLNYAEAQLELGNEPEARIYVNKIRNRAGMSEIDGVITMDDYRQERKIELAFEENRYLDFKRWRIYDKVMNNKPAYAIWPVYNIDKNVYTFRTQMLPAGKFTRNFNANLYYNQIPATEIETNPLIVQNPGY